MDLSSFECEIGDRGIKALTDRICSLIVEKLRVLGHTFDKCKMIDNLIEEFNGDITLKDCLPEQLTEE